jgi:hypothetical protein
MPEDILSETLKTLTERETQIAKMNDKFFPLASKVNEPLRLVEPIHLTAYRVFAAVGVAAFTPRPNRSKTRPSGSSVKYCVKGIISLIQSSQRKIKGRAVRAYGRLTVNASKLIPEKRSRTDAK